MNGDLHIMCPGEKQRLYNDFLVDLEDLKEGGLHTEECSSNSFHQSPRPTEEHRGCLDNQHNMAEGQEQKPVIPSVLPVSDRQHVSVPVPGSLAVLAGPEDPVSAAAHLHLLGEALSLIGCHLQETNKTIPELTSDTECPLAPTLENIAYVMPGL